ncbi:DUF3696 domain-containing protein [Acidobacteriia bacterium AH_259_A11_L15]|nr:DUF3696 domain-containing protein [Acidobacteriia bacterium AH_259_A11_L15]
MAKPRFEFRWQNFRSFYDTGWIGVKPITVLLGANNTGKTSLMLPLLVLRQTLDSADPNVALKTTGPMVSIGTYRDMVYRHRVNEPVSFHLRFAYPRKEQDKGKKRLKRVGPYPPGILTLQFVAGETESEVKLGRYQIRDVYNRPYVTRKLRPNNKYSLEFPQQLPQRFLESVNRGKPEHFFFSASSVINEFLRKQIGKTGIKERKKKRGVILQKLNIAGPITHYWMVSASAEGDVSRLISHLSYVGPLRERPKRSYESSEETPESVGVRGENAPLILFHRKESDFQKRIRDWLREFELADKVECNELGRGIFTVEILGRKKGWRVDFVDTGFGLSQLLPLIVEGFHSKAGDMIFVEQPEIHLNPRLQCKLANLFATLAREERSIIVETHSEHFILRLRSLIAEKKIRADDVALYFVEKRRGESSVRAIRIQEDGHIEPDEWPQGFFEDSIGEALRLARALDQSAS